MKEVRWTHVLMTSLLIGLAVLPASVLAATPKATPTPAASPGQGLEISPPVIQLTANPGETVKATIRVRDVSSGNLIAKGKADDFGASGDESGNPKLLLDEPSATRYSLKYWVQSVPDLQLAPQELKTADITINVPPNAEPGGHFGVIRFTAVPPNLGGTGVALSASIGSLILLKVNGPVMEKLSLAEFFIGPTHGDTAPVTRRTFFETGPVNFVARVKNEGTVHEHPQGTITIKNIFGRQIATINVNDKGGNVLPDSIRRYEQVYDQKKLLGRYTATLALTYANGQKLTGQLSFWVVPWKLILLAFLALVLLIIAGRWLIRRYNAHIIAQARRAK